MENCMYMFIDDSPTEENVVLTINDNYNNSDICEYCMPVPETKCPEYTVVEPEKDLSKETYHDINYNTVSYNL